MVSRALPSNLPVRIAYRSDPGLLTLLCVAGHSGWRASRYLMPEGWRRRNLLFDEYFDLAAT
jgi:hypothetical protein